ncbi:PREDICTED: fasciculation and elongation protein zeta-1 [Hipposideros armiger]|uniref:Fasciculation and elongation protein zeta-1 n=1 Tax=Hipposideros armiger TaxID=186990 RepID=A0A8B7SQT3_HIPAR|nr:PREDICTED: fasciculation and elongation protein zeta-1 [Hipposideros armiger]
MTHGSRACQWAGARALARPRSPGTSTGRRRREGGGEFAAAVAAARPPLPGRCPALRSGSSVDGGVPLSPGTRLPPPGPAQVQSRGATLVRTNPRQWVGVGRGGEEAPRPGLPGGTPDPSHPLLFVYRVWDALTDNYIPSLSEDWRDPNIEALNGNSSDTEVIEEIEEMMQNSPDPEEEEEVLEEEDGGETSSQADSVLLQEMQALTQTFNNNWSYEGLRHMSGSELTELLDQVEGAIRDFSEELVQQLARRDELEFEKEVKNSFITVLIEVQNKQKEQRELMKKRRKEKGLSLQSSRIEKGNQMPLKRFSMEGISNILQSGIRQTFGSSGTDKQYLNTVIPYEKKASPPSVEDLQMLTNILFAMKEDNEKVPTLLTDYILKVLCPT